MVRSRPGVVSPDAPTRVEGAPKEPVISGSGKRGPAAGSGGALLAEPEDESSNESSGVFSHKAAAEPLPESERPFGRYTLLRRLAFGGMGEIFLARQGGAGSLSSVAKLVVIKRILSHMKRDEKHRRMFLDEARLQALLNNTHIVQIHDMGEELGHVYLAMEHVHGPSWRALIDRCRKNREHIPLAHVVSMVQQAAAGLGYAHNLVDVTGSPLRIVHRDINPHNVLVTYDGEVKIIDFGIAKSELADGQTETGTIKGKFSYMSPEQSAADPLDKRSDIFALGICLQELLTLENPFRRGNVVLSLEAIQKDQPPPLARKRKDAAALQSVVDKCLAKNRDDRFDDCSEVAIALEALVQNGLVPAPSQPMASWLRERFQDQIAEHVHILEQTGSTNALVARGSDPGLPRRLTNASSSFPRPNPDALTAMLDEDPTGEHKKRPVTEESPEPLPEEPAVELTSSTPQEAFDVKSIADSVEPVKRPTRAPFYALGFVLVLAGSGAAAFVAFPAQTRAAIADMRVRVGLDDAPAVVVVVPAVPKPAPDRVDPPAPPPADKQPDAPPVVAPHEDAAVAVAPVVPAVVPHDDPAPAHEDPRPAQKKHVEPARTAIATVAVTSEGYAVRGGRKVYAGEATALQIDKESGAPFGVKMRVRIDDAGNATVDVDSEPWAVVRVNGIGKGKTPMRGLLLPAQIELSNPTAGKMSVSLKTSK